MFDDVPVICQITRQDLIDDGRLIEVTVAAQEKGIKFPTAITDVLNADIQAIPKSSYEDYDGRLSDVLFMFVLAVRQKIPAVPLSHGGNLIRYRLIMPCIGTRTRDYEVQAVVGPGDNAEPVLTLFRGDEAID